MSVLPVIIFCVSIIITLSTILIRGSRKDEDTITITKNQLREIIHLTIAETIKQLELEKE